MYGFNDNGSRREFLRSGAFGAGAVLLGPRLARSRRAPTTAISGTISLWAWGAGPEFDAWQERIAYFNSKYPDVEVQFEPLARNGYEEYPQLLTRIAGGNAPDVLRVLNFQPTQLVAQGKALLALDDYIAKTTDFAQDDFFESVWRGAPTSATETA